MTRLVATAYVWVVVTAIAEARDIYVNNKGGDDRHAGRSESTAAGDSGPCRTIARALRAAQKGDRIILVNTGMPYRESVTLLGAKHSGTERHPFEFIGNGATLEGAGPVPQEAWEHVGKGVFRFAPQRMSYQQLYRDGVPLERVSLSRSETRLPELKPLQWCLLQRKIYFRAEENKLPHNYDLSYCVLPLGIRLDTVRNVIVRDLIIQGFQTDGLLVSGNVSDTTIRSVTVRGNARSGIAICGASRVTLADSLIGNNGESQLRTEDYSHTHLSNCDLLDNTAPPVDQQGGEIYQNDAQASQASADQTGQP